MAKRTAARSQRGGDVLTRVVHLARNLWWTWSDDAQRLFAGIDPLLWETNQHNPIAVVNRLAPERRAHLLADQAFAQQVTACEAALAAYLKQRTWFDGHAKGKQKQMRVAYFCAEYALHECFAQYSGGLGVLAGDHLKSASDLGIPLVAVGLLYRSGYYQQQLSARGETQPLYPEYNFDELPVSDTGKQINIPFGARTLHAKVWVAQIGRVPLYLLDADVPQNRPADRKITQYLYGGDNELRIQQELLLGVGGYRALQTLRATPTVVHLNEGHAAFAGLEKLRLLRKQRVAYDTAVESVRSSTVFTTHTPVPAGHDRFAPALTARYLKPLADEIGLDRRGLLALGRENPADSKETFCMTVLALKLSGRANGVAELHGATSREMWQNLFGVASPSDVPIGHITNGVHTATWLAPEMRPLHEKYFRIGRATPKPSDDPWASANRIPDDMLWERRNLLRQRLVHFIRRKLLEQARRRFAATDEMTAAVAAFDENALTIGFARRFATYKRAPLAFHNPKRLAAILTDAKRPVQLVFAGKAHPADKGGQAFAQQIFEFAKKNGFVGRVALLENYDMEIGRMLTSGCDVWLNNPLRPMEASGTSGMKPPLHGGLNCSILDGWWPEAYDGKNGWAIGDAAPQKTQAKQDAYDAEHLYRTLENEVVPLFYQRTRDGLPKQWVQRMKHSMATVCGQFNTHRMVGQYVEQYYLPTHESAT